MFAVCSELNLVAVMHFFEASRDGQQCHELDAPLHQGK